MLKERLSQARVGLQGLWQKGADRGSQALERAKVLSGRARELAERAKVVAKLAGEPAVTCEAGLKREATSLTGSPFFAAGSVVGRGADCPVTQVEGPGGAGRASRGSSGPPGRRGGRCCATPTTVVQPGRPVPASA